LQRTLVVAIVLAVMDSVKAVATNLTNTNKVGYVSPTCKCSEWNPSAVRKVGTLIEAMLTVDIILSQFIYCKRKNCSQLYQSEQF